MWFIPGATLANANHFSQEELLDKIESLTRIGFYGTLEIRFENGLMVYLRKMETIKPGNIRITDYST